MKLQSLVTKPLVLTILANFMGVLQFGINIAMPSNTQDVIQDFLNETLTRREGKAPPKERLTMLWAIIVAILYLGGFLGALGNRLMINGFSRRRGLLSTNIFGGFTSVVVFLALPTTTWELLLVGRFLMGIHTGLTGAQIAIYISEISPTSIRGTVSSLVPLGIVLTILISQVLAFPVVLGTADRWHFLYGCGIVPCALQFIFLPFCVESPRHLMMEKRDTEAARLALRKLRGTSDVDDDIDEMEEEMRKSKAIVPLLEIIRHAPYRRATALATICHMSLHLCGLNGVQLYANRMFQESANLSRETASYVTSGQGVVAIVMTLAMMPLTDVAGRKSLELIGLSGQLFSLIAATICLALMNAGMMDVTNIAVIVFLMLFMVFFNVGPAIIPWVVVGEYFSQEVKPMASAIAISSNWLSGMVTSYLFPLFVENVSRDYAFTPFCVYLVVIIIVLYIHLPETKGKTFEEISAMFESPRELPGCLKWGKTSRKDGEKEMLNRNALLKPD